MRWILPIVMLGLVGGRTGFAADLVSSLSAQLDRYEQSLGAIEADISDLERAYRTAEAETFQYTMERRLLDATILYDFKAYDKAVVLLAELVSRPEFKANRDYWSVVFKLGDSLFKIGNNRAATRHFASIIDASVRGLTQPALQYLLDITMKTRDFGLFNSYYPVLDALPAASRTDGLTYTYAKLLYFQRAYQDAAAELRRVPMSSPYHARSNYYLGVTMTQQKQLEAALQAFKAAVESAGKAEDEPEGFQDLCRLGVGRTLDEMKRNAEAVDAYQEIPRTSVYYETSLYEMTWAYIQLQEFSRALNSLETLILVSEDDDLLLEANILRGRLNIYLKQYQDAEGAYEEVVDRFTPLKAELMSFMESRRGVREFFRWLMANNTERSASRRPLSARALEWMATDDQMTKVFGVFHDIRGQKGEVSEHLKLIEKLRARLDSKSAMEIFPNLSKGWYSLAEQENQLIRLSSSLLNLERRLVESMLPADVLPIMKKVWETRDRLERGFEKIPLTIVAYSSRKTTVSKKFERYDAELYLIQGKLTKALKDIEALEQWIQQHVLSANGRPRKATPSEKKVIAEVMGEKKWLGDVLSKVNQIRGKLDIGRSTVGIGDVVMQSETNLKNHLIGVQSREAGLYQAQYEGLPPAEKRFVTRMSEIRKRISGDFKRLSAVVGSLKAKTTGKVRETRRLVEKERKLMREFAEDLKVTEKVAMATSEKIGSLLFVIARNRIEDVVLKADLGLIDIAWKKKRVVTSEIQDHNQARSKQIQAIDKNLKGIVGN
jgi:tetratricopeptide (TPR) repeat protein